MSGPIDLSRLPPPNAVEELSVEELQAAWWARAVGDVPEIEGLNSEADPARKWLRTGAFRELLVRQRVNDATRGNMLATAKRGNLENLAALFGIERRVVDPGDPDARPPVPPTRESDESLLRRTQLFPSSISSAGPRSAYIFHALSASPLVRDAQASSPNPAEVTVTVLTIVGGGAASQAVLDAVTAALSADSVRPMGDRVTVESAAIVEYRVVAGLEIGTGPDAGAVRDAAEAGVRAMAERLRALGSGAPRSALIAALHAEGVRKVDLTEPAADVAATSVQSAYATAFEVTVQ